MPITVKYDPNPSTIGLAAQYAGYGSYLKDKQAQQMKKLELVSSVKDRIRQRELQAQGQSDDSAARQRQMQMQAQQMQMDQANRQGQLELQGRGQNLDAYNRQQQLALQGRGQEIDAYGRQQQTLAGLYQAGMSQQGQNTREWLQGQARVADQQVQNQGRLDLEAQQAQSRQAQFELQFTTQQQARVAQLNQGLEWVRQQETNGQLTPEQAATMRWQIGQEQAGIRPTAMPRPTPPTRLQDVAPDRVMRGEDGSVTILQPDGRIEFQRAPTGGQGGQPRPMTDAQRLAAVERTFSNMTRTWQQSGQQGPAPTRGQAQAAVQATLSGEEAGEQPPQQGQPPPEFMAQLERELQFLPPDQRDQARAGAMQRFGGQQQQAQQTQQGQQPPPPQQPGMSADSIIQGQMPPWLREQVQQAQQAQQAQGVPQTAFARQAREQQIRAMPPDRQDAARMQDLRALSQVPGHPAIQALPVIEDALNFVGNMASMPDENWQRLETAMRVAVEQFPDQIPERFARRFRDAGLARRNAAEAEAGAAAEVEEGRAEEGRSAARDAAARAAPARGELTPEQDAALQAASAGRPGPADQARAARLQAATQELARLEQFRTSRQFEMIPQARQEAIMRQIQAAVAERNRNRGAG